MEKNRFGSSFLNANRSISPGPSNKMLTVSPVRSTSYSTASFQAKMSRLKLPYSLLSTAIKGAGAENSTFAGAGGRAEDWGAAVKGAEMEATGAAIGTVGGAVGDAIGGAAGGAAGGAIDGAAGGAVDGAVGGAVGAAVDGAVGAAVDGSVDGASKADLPAVAIVDS